MAPASQQPIAVAMGMAGIWKVRPGAGWGSDCHPAGAASRMDLDPPMGKNHPYGKNRPDRR